MNIKRPPEQLLKLWNRRLVAMGLSADIAKRMKIKSWKQKAQRKAAQLKAQQRLESTGRQHDPVRIDILKRP